MLLWKCVANANGADDLQSVRHLRDVKRVWVAHTSRHGFARSESAFGANVVRYAVVIPTERQARIVAKRVTDFLYGTQSVDDYVDQRISSGGKPDDVNDWKFVKSINPALQFDILKYTQELFQRLAPHRGVILDH